MKIRIQGIQKNVTSMVVFLILYFLKFVGVFLEGIPLFQSGYMSDAQINLQVYYFYYKEKN